MNNTKLAKWRAMVWIICMAPMAWTAPRAAGDPTPAVVTTGPVGAVGASASNTYAPAANYRLSVKDTVHIRVFQEGDLDTTARIDKDGTIPFPLIGTAKIGGETVQEAKATMEALLREYLVKPQVSLDITTYAKRRFTILGQVNRPGVFEIPEETSITLLEAIGMADGYTKIANPAKIKVKRIVQGNETIIPVNAKDMLDPKKGITFEVLPGDTIMVGEALF